MARRSRPLVPVAAVLLLVAAALALAGPGTAAGASGDPTDSSAVREVGASVDVALRSAERAPVRAPLVVTVLVAAGAAVVLTCCPFATGTSGRPRSAALLSAAPGRAPPRPAHRAPR